MGFKLGKHMATLILERFEKGDLTLEQAVSQLTMTPDPSKKVDLRAPGVTQHKDTVKRIHALYVAKNADYGDSFIKSLEKRGLGSVGVRFDDKVGRFDTLAGDYNPKVQDESIVDTLLDLANYAIMTVMWIESRESTMTEQLNNNIVEDTYGPTKEDNTIKKFIKLVEGFDYIRVLNNGGTSGRIILANGKPIVLYPHGDNYEERVINLSVPFGKYINEHFRTIGFGLYYEDYCAKEIYHHLMFRFNNEDCEKLLADVEVWNEH